MESVSPLPISFRTRVLYKNIKLNVQYHPKVNIPMFLIQTWSNVYTSCCKRTWDDTFAANRAICEHLFNAAKEINSIFTPCSCHWRKWASSFKSISKLHPTFLVILCISNHKYTSVDGRFKILWKNLEKRML